MILKKGMVNNTVKYWQKFINSFYVNPVLVEDGNFGSKTEAYTKEYQSDNHLVPDGIVGTLTFSIAKAQGLILPEEIKTDLQEIVIDISHYQIITSFDKIKDAGIKGVIHKATEGLQYKEKQFQYRKEQFLERGILFGAYHFCRNNRMDLQDDFFLNYIGDTSNMLLALDFEDYSIPISSVERMVQEVYDRIGRYPYLYTGIGLVQGKVKADSILKNCKIWWARYSNSIPKIPYPLQDWTLWQHTDKGRVNGIQGYVDMNYFRGDDLSKVWAV